MTMNLAQIESLLREGAHTIFGMMDTYGRQWKDIYQTQKSEKNQEYMIEMKFPGLATIKDEGAPGMDDTLGQRFTYTFKHRTLWQSFSVTREAIQDNLYKTQFPRQAESLKESIIASENVLGANPLNNAFNAAYPIGDGQPMCSVAHPIDGGTYSNAFGAGTAYVDLSEAGLEQALITIQAMKMQSGILAFVKDSRLLYGPSLQFQGARLTESAYRPEVANNDINAINNGRYLPDKPVVNQYITNPNSWFILTNAKGLVHFERTGEETDTYADFKTQSVSVSITKRLSFGCYDARSIFGSPGV